MRQVIVVGALGHPKTQALLYAVHAAFVPNSKDWLPPHSR